MTKLWSKNTLSSSPKMFFKILKKIKFAMQKNNRACIFHLTVVDIKLHLSAIENSQFILL